jgi:hypothetical protein
VKELQFNAEIEIKNIKGEAIVVPKIKEEGFSLPFFTS